MKKIFLLLTLFLCSSMAWALFKVEVDGIYYDRDPMNHTASVSSSSGEKYTGSIVIPESITVDGTTYKVISLGESCFSGCKDLASITIPNSVTSFGNSCFLGCTGLTSITIPNSVKSLDRSCFHGCI